MTSSQGVQKVTMEHIKKVLENRPIKEGLEGYQNDREMPVEKELNLLERIKLQIGMNKMLSLS